MTAEGGGQARATAGIAGAVHVVDDDEEVGWAIATLLMSAGVVAETYESGLALIEALPALREDDIGCILTDVRMPGLDGLHLLRLLMERGFRRPIILMTAHGDVSTAVEAMKAGAFDFVEKPFTDEALLAAIGAGINAPEIAGKLGAAARGGGLHPMTADAVSRITALSPREREVLNLLMAGKPNKAVARDLGLSLRTVEIHRARMMTRLEVDSLAEAVRLAVWAELAR